MFELTPYNGGGISRFFDDWDKSFWGDPFWSTSGRMMTDIRDKGNYYELSCDLPGFERDEISVDVDDKYLTVSAAKEQSASSDIKSDYLRRERYSGKFSRSFGIGGIDADKIEVSYHNGVLTVVMPKSESKAQKSRKIDIK